LANMDSDDAADLILELGQERRIPVLELLPATKQRKIRTLLGYNPSTAGGLMGVDFLLVDEGSTVAQTLAAARASEIPAKALGFVFLHDGDGLLSGALSLV